jgi:hypothetical protein
MQRATAAWTCRRFGPLVLLSCPFDFGRKHHALIVETQMLSGELGVLGLDPELSESAFMSAEVDNLISSAEARIEQQRKHVHDVASDFEGTPNPSYVLVPSR